MCRSICHGGVSCALGQCGTGSVTSAKTCRPTYCVRLPRSAQISFFKALSSSRDKSDASFPQKSQRPPPPTCQTPLSLRVVPHAANHSAEQPSTPGDPHKLVCSRFAQHSFTHAAGCRVARQHLCFDGQAVNGRVLAARAQEPSVGIADRWLATWRMQNQAVRAAVARSVSPRWRCAAVPTDASMSARSALKATSEVGTGGLATRVIEADVLYRPVPAIGTHAGC